MLARGIGRGKPRPENQSYWMSYSDMMAALLLMFVLLLFLSFNRYVTLQDTKEAELAAKEEELALQQEQLARSQEELQENQRALRLSRHHRQHMATGRARRAAGHVPVDGAL